MSSFVLWALSILAGSAGIADPMPVPVELQAALFKKIFDYDRTLQSQPQVRVLVLYPTPAEEPQTSRDLVAAFDQHGVSATALPANELASRIEEAAVVYLLPGVDPAFVEPLCLEKGILSVSGLPELAETGSVAIGIGSRDQKPKVLIHLRRVKAERHELAAGLLSLAEVIR